MSRPCRYAASAKSSWVRYRSPPSHRAPCCVRSMQRHVTRCAATPRGIFLTGTASRSTTARRRRASPSTKSERCTSPHDGAGPRRKAACSASRRVTMVCAANQRFAASIARALPLPGFSGRLFDRAKGEGIALSQYDLAEVRRRHCHANSGLTRRTLGDGRCHSRGPG